MDWTAILTRAGCSQPIVQRWAPVFAVEAAPARFSLGQREIDEFLGQVLHESAMLTAIVENLTYSTPERLCAVWPKRFPTTAHAAPYVRNPEALGDKVYGGRMGNISPGDGFKFRGRGCIMVTGRAGYRTTGQALGLDLEAKPELLENPAIALRAAVAWWEGHIPDKVLGDVDIVAETRLVNGGTVGLAHRQLVTNAARQALA